MATAASAMSGDADRENDRPFRTKVPRDRRTGLDGATLAGHDHLARRVAVRDDEGAVDFRGSDELGEPIVRQPDDRGHGAVPAAARRLHELATSTHEPDPVL